MTVSADSQYYSASEGSSPHTPRRGPGKLIIPSSSPTGERIRIRNLDSTPFKDTPPNVHSPLQQEFAQSPTKRLSRKRRHHEVRNKRRQRIITSQEGQDSLSSQAQEIREGQDLLWTKEDQSQIDMPIIPSSQWWENDSWIEEDVEVVWDTGESEMEAGEQEDPEVVYDSLTSRRLSKDLSFESFPQPPQIMTIPDYDMTNDTLARDSFSTARQ